MVFEGLNFGYFGGLGLGLWVLCGGLVWTLGFLGGFEAFRVWGFWRPEVGVGSAKSVPCQNFPKPQTMFREYREEGLQEVDPPLSWSSGLLLQKVRKALVRS